MIEKQTVYSLFCDSCGRHCGDTDVSQFSDKESLLSTAELLDWRKLKGKWYCPNCYTVDDYDNYIPTESIRIPITWK